MDLFELLVTRWGYLAVFLGTFLEGETIVLLAGLAAYQGLLDVELVTIAAFSGSYLGDQLYFFLSRRFGRPWVERRPRVRQKVDRVLRLLDRWGDLFVLVFRFLYGVRSASSIAIGISKYPAPRFAFLNGVAAALWAVAFTWIGYAFAHAIWYVLDDLEDYQNAALLGLLGLCLTYGLVVLVRWVQAARQRDGAAPKAREVGADPGDCQGD